MTDEFPHKGPVTEKMFPFDDVIMNISHGITLSVFLVESWTIMIDYVLEPSVLPIKPDKPNNMETGNQYKQPWQLHRVLFRSIRS